MSEKNITYNFTAKNKNKSKQHSATDCSAQSAVSSIKQQLNFHQKLPSNNANDLTLLNCNKMQQHLHYEESDEFTSSLIKSSLNTESLKERNEQEINLFKAAAKDSKHVDVENTTKQEMNDHTLKKLEDVLFYKSQQKFKPSLNLKTNQKQKIWKSFVTHYYKKWMLCLRKVVEHKITLMWNQQQSW